jgi:hypothetical protein
MCHVCAIYVLHMGYRRATYVLHTSIFVTYINNLVLLNITLSGSQGLQFCLYSVLACSLVLILDNLFSRLPLLY